MSCNNWEEGTIVLPSAQVAPLKKTLRDTANQFHADVLAKAKSLHQQAATTNPTKYVTFLLAQYTAIENSRRGFSLRPVTPNLSAVYAKRVTKAALAVLRHTSGDYGWQKPTRVPAPTAKHLAEMGIRKYTNKDNEFTVIGKHGYQEASITFEGREVTWQVGEGNRAVEDARGGVLAHVFFTALSKMTWTRGTGGHLVGNDEYNEDSRESGGGANYITDTFGPLGNDTKIRDYMRMGFSKKEATRIVTTSR